MERAANIFLAKRNIVDLIWKQARLEGVNVTFPETATVLDGCRVEAVCVKTVLHEMTVMTSLIGE